MQILIRTVRTSLSSDTKRYLRKRVLKYELLIPNSSVIECTFEEKSGPRRDGNKIVHISARVPGIKKPIFVKSKASPNFKSAIDTAEAKFGRVVHKQLEIQKSGGKRGCNNPCRGETGKGCSSSRARAYGLHIGAGYSSDLRALGGTNGIH